MPTPTVALSVAATGRLEEVVAKGDSTTYVWDSGAPAGPGRVGFAVDAFTHETIQGPGGLVVDVDVPPGVDPDVRDDLDAVPEVIAFLESRFGSYPFETLGFAWIRNAPLPPSVAGLSLQARTFLVGNISEQDLAHHLARHWFSSSVSAATASDDWLAQAVVAYAELLWMEHAEGPERRDAFVGLIYRGLGSSTRPPAVATDPADVGDQKAEFDRGGLALHALRLELGDETFFRFVKTYAERFRHGTATTADLIAVAEDVSGENLHDFFDAWLYQEAVPSIPQLGLTAGT